MLKGVIFDLDDTLYEYQELHKQAIKKVEDYAEEVLHIDKRDFASALNAAKRETKEELGQTASSHNRLLYFQKTLEILGENPLYDSLELYECYWNEILSTMELRPGALELLQNLQEQGIKIAICTDLTVHIQHRKLRKLGIVPYVDVLVTSEEAGIEKPSPRIFCLCLKKLNLTAKEVLFVGDSYDKDILGAKQAGIPAVLFSKDKMHQLKNVEVIHSFSVLGGCLNAYKD